MESFKIRVQPGSKVQGFTICGVPARIQPGEYVAHWLSTNRAGSTDLEAALRFLGANEDKSGDDVQLFQADWPALKSWPDLDQASPFQLLA